MWQFTPSVGKNKALCGTLTAYLASKLPKHASTTVINFVQAIYSKRDQMTVWLGTAQVKLIPPLKSVDSEVSMTDSIHSQHTIQLVNKNRTFGQILRCYNRSK